MSVDYDCYLENKPSFGFENIEGDGWQIAIYGPHHFDEEDLDPEIYEQIGKKSYLLNLHLEGQADDFAYDKLEKLLEKLIKNYGACIYDPQQDLIISKKGHTPIIRNKIEVKTEKLASLSFYFDQKFAFTNHQRIEFYKLVETIIPKALPRRYGHYEPMQYKLAETGKEHFLKHWRDDRIGILWRGSAPYQWVNSGLKHSESNTHNAINPKEIFICQKIEIQFSTKLLTTKKALSQLIKFQIEASIMLKIFYSEIRYGDSVSSKAWRGLPKEPALTAIIGKPYANLWPDFTDNSDKVGTHFYMRRYLSSEHKIPKMPDDLVAPDIPKENPLNSAPPIATVFPFEIPKKSKGIPERYKA